MTPPDDMPPIPRPPGVPRIEGAPPPPESDPGGPHSRASTALFDRLANLQVTRPWRVLGVVMAITAVSLLLAARLTVLTGFENLLPQSRPSVQELNRVAARTAGVSTLFIVLEAGEGTPVEALRKAADALVPELEKLGPPWVGSAEDGVHEALHFLGPRAGLYADKDKLAKLRDDVEARYNYEVSKVTGTDLGLDDEEPPPPIDAASLQKTFAIEGAAIERYPDGYFQSKDGKAVVVAIRSKVLGSDFAQGNEALTRIRAVVDRVNPASFHPAITYAFGGDLQSGISEYTSINNDLTEVGYLGAVMIIAVVFLYYLRVRTLITMVITIAVGVAWTFGITEIFIGHLNLATGFLFTIVAGNGINFGIIYMSRYAEVRRRGGTLAEGIRVAHRETWLPTATAGFAAGASYGSLMVTEFRGFRDFGLIGGVGMVVCWFATYLTLPSVLSVIERVTPHEKPGPLAQLRRITQGGVAFGRPFAWIATAAPRTVALGGTALGLAGIVALAIWIKNDPMEYDLRNLRNDESARAREIAVTRLAEDVTGYVGADGMAILVDRPEQVPLLRAELYKRRDAAPEGKKPFHDVHALQDFVPAEQEAKIPMLLDIKDKVMRAKKRGVIDEETWKKIESFIPPDDLKPFGIADLPAGMSRSFTETDGTRGRIVYISPIDNEAVHDAHYLFRWADSYRETKLPDGSTVLGSGRAVIYADMWEAIIGDVPPAVGISLAATLAVVIIAFRAGRPAIAVIASLMIGVGWLSIPLALLDVKLNFLNFIALPLTFGIGVDYAVNIVQRYVREGAGGAVTAVKETGGAVILCSMTTTLGYLALIKSLNFSVRSLGIAAVLGEITCLLAAVLVLPAALVWLDRKRPAGGDSIVSMRPPRGA